MSILLKSTSFLITLKSTNDTAIILHILLIDPKPKHGSSPQFPLSLLSPVMK